MNPPGKCLPSLNNIRKMALCLDIKSGNNKAKARDCEQVKRVGFLGQGGAGGLLKVWPHVR